MSTDVDQQVAFQTVREAARAQLGSFVDELDFVELFEFLIHCGVGNNTFVDDLLRFGSKFVDSKKRQLRLSAFAQANKMNDAAPRTKIAVIKRAYRKQPKDCVCPSPEPAWGDAPWDLLQLLTRLLRFSMCCAKHSANAMSYRSRGMLSWPTSTYPLQMHSSQR